MKIGILTFHHVDNYGAAWQCYGLCNALERLGHEPFLINYRPPGALLAYRLPKGKFCLTPRMLGYFKKRMLFDRFRTNHLPEQTEKMFSYEQLAAKEWRASAFIAGSDQIWNPTITGGRYDPSYFLGFAGRARKIAYAASFGETQNIDLSDGLRSMLAGLDHVSVRETGARDTLVEAFGIDIDVVCDPAVLTQSYADFLSPRESGAEYIFCYNLFNREMLDKTCADLAADMACDVRRVNDDWKFWKYKTRPEFGIGPIRWLNNIHKARCVITDSFHATVFSVLLEKDFVVSLANDHKGKSNRIVSFLAELGLETRIMSDEDTLQDVGARMHAPVDWQAVGGRIGRLGARSLRFLETALAPACGPG